jgi:hypothetical protein
MVTAHWASENAYGSPSQQPSATNVDSAAGSKENKDSAAKSMGSSKKEFSLDKKKARLNRAFLYTSNDQYDQSIEKLCNVTGSGFGV